jgi:PEGA domain
LYTFSRKAGFGGFQKIYQSLKNMVKRMPGKFPLLLVITIILVAGCMTTVPEDTPEEIPATGSVEVSSTPPGAEVYLDNVYRGTTPVTVFDLPGSHTLELRLRDHQSWSKSIRIDAGTRAFVDTSLAAVPVITSIPTTVPATRPTTVPTTRPRLVTTPTTISPAPTQTPTPWPRTFLGCFKFESHGWTGTGESFNLTETWWFQPAGVGLANGTWIYPPPKKPEISLTGFTWSRDPKTDLVAVTIVGQGTPAEVHYNGNNDTITFSNRNMGPTIFPRVACWM